MLRADWMASIMFHKLVDIVLVSIILNIWNHNAHAQSAVNAHHGLHIECMAMMNVSPTSGGIESGCDIGSLFAIGLIGGAHQTLPAERRRTDVELSLTIAWHPSNHYPMIHASIGGGVQQDLVPVSSIRAMIEALTQMPIGPFVSIASSFAPRGWSTGNAGQISAQFRLGLSFKPFQDTTLHIVPVLELENETIEHNPWSVGPGVIFYAFL